MNTIYSKKLFCSLLTVTLLSLINPVNSIGQTAINTPDSYWKEVHTLFQKNEWSTGKKVLDKGLKDYPNESVLNELNGQYFYHRKEYDKARYYLINALKFDKKNVRARQILVNVEDETKNYSSAICYVNELLEVTPYYQGLWKRKIELYRKQGNIVESNRLLRRICQIYPNDTTLNRNFTYALEENFYRVRNTNKDEAISNLKEIIKSKYAKESHYMDLTNMLLQQGKIDEALEIAAKGANIFKSSNLIKKRAGILAEQGRYTEAMAYIQEWRKSVPNKSLATLESQLLTESARAENQHDPYVLYGKLYEQRRSKEALTYLLNTSISRGYNDDALYYIKQAKKSSKGKELQKLLYKEYTVYKRMGNKMSAEKTLKECYAANPNDNDVLEEMVNSHLALSDESMRIGDYTDALKHLDFVINNSYDSETLEIALRKEYNCYYSQQKYKKALHILDQINELYPMPNTQDLLKRATTLEKQGEENKALNTLITALDTCSVANRQLYIDAYEEVSIPYIKRLQEEGARNAAYQEVTRLLSYNPKSDDALRYATNISLEKEEYSTAQEYIDLGKSLYPKELFYIIKQAQIYKHDKEYQSAINLLELHLIDYPANKDLIGAFSENIELKTLQLIKEHKNAEALETVDLGLDFDKKNRSLLYAKGLAYEAAHEYDSAHFYQKYYQPELINVAETKRHLNSLNYRGYKNEVETAYLATRHADQDVLTSVYSLSYRRMEKKNRYSLSLNYTGRDGNADRTSESYQVTGGMGIQITPGWEHDFSQFASNSINIGWSNKYFPVWSINDQITLHGANEWEFDILLGYRCIHSYNQELTWKSDETGQYGWMFDKWEDKKNNMYQAGIGVNKTLNQTWLNTKFQGNVISSKLYYNWSGQFRYFPLNDGISYINALASIGTSPEASIIDYALPGSFNKLNALFAISGQYLLAEHMALGFTGSWNTYYNQTNQRSGTQENPVENISTNYKNLYSILLQILIRF